MFLDFDFDPCLLVVYVKLHISHVVAFIGVDEQRKQTKTKKTKIKNIDLKWMEGKMRSEQRNFGRAFLGPPKMQISDLILET